MRLVPAARNHSMLQPAATALLCADRRRRSSSRKDLLAPLLPHAACLCEVFGPTQAAMYVLLCFSLTIWSTFIHLYPLLALHPLQARSRLDGYRAAGGCLRVEFKNENQFWGPGKLPACCDAVLCCAVHAGWGACRCTGVTRGWGGRTAHVSHTLVSQLPTYHMP